MTVGAPSKAGGGPARGAPQASYGDKTPEQLDRATLGKLVGWVEPILADNLERDRLIGDLRELNQLRIAVVHRLPSLLELWDTVVWRFEYLRPVTGGPSARGSMHRPTTSTCTRRWPGLSGES